MFPSDVTVITGDVAVRATSLDNLPRIGATLLCARRLAELDDRPSPATIATVENAISQASFILDRIDRKWPSQTV
jgi:hypothetical protein